jgi:hypothetical protein
LNKPKYVKVDDELYEINTDFRIALECNRIAEDENIGSYERALAIIYKLFGEKRASLSKPIETNSTSRQISFIGQRRKRAKKRK